MSKKRKNSNYITPKRIEAFRKAQRESKNAKIKRTLLYTLVPIVTVLIIAAAIALMGFAFDWWGQSFEATYHATVEIEDYGTVHLELYGNEAPKTVENFIKLAEAGYYNGLTFHRIIEGFMAQGGRSDEPCDTIVGEFSENGYDNPIEHRRGVISMARSDAYNSASSQFFIVHETSPHLDGKYAAFGRVTSGMDVIDRICKEAEPTDSNGTVPAAEQPVITSITVHPVH